MARLSRELRDARNAARHDHNEARRRLTEQQDRAYELRARAEIATLKEKTAKFLTSAQVMCKDNDQLQRLLDQQS